MIQQCDRCKTGNAVPPLHQIGHEMLALCTRCKLSRVSDSAERSRRRMAILSRMKTRAFRNMLRG